MVACYLFTVAFCRVQEKEQKKVARAEKAEHRLKKKAVQQHEHFKEAMKILREHRMGAKQGRLLLKRHYVALIADAGGVEEPGTCPLNIFYTYTHQPPTHKHILVE